MFTSNTTFVQSAIDCISPQPQSLGKGQSYAVNTGAAEILIFYRSRQVRGLRADPNFQTRDGSYKVDLDIPYRRVTQMQL
jgi:hypothetical protein